MRGVEIDDWKILTNAEEVIRREMLEACRANAVAWRRLAPFWRTQKTLCEIKRRYPELFERTKRRRKYGQILLLGRTNSP
jgi:hypothetical protein